MLLRFSYSDLRFFSEQDLSESYDHHYGVDDVVYQVRLIQSDNSVGLDKQESQRQVEEREAYLRRDIKRRLRLRQHQVCKQPAAYLEEVPGHLPAEEPLHRHELRREQQPDHEEPQEPYRREPHQQHRHYHRVRLEYLPLQPVPVLYLREPRQVVHRERRGYHHQIHVRYPVHPLPPAGLLERQLADDVPPQQQLDHRHAGRRDDGHQRVLEIFLRRRGAEPLPEILPAHPREFPHHEERHEEHHALVGDRTQQRTLQAESQRERQREAQADYAVGDIDAHILPELLEAVDDGYQHVVQRVQQHREPEHHEHVAVRLVQHYQPTEPPVEQYHHQTDNHRAEDGYPKRRRQQAVEFSLVLFVLGHILRDPGVDAAAGELHHDRGEVVQLADQRHARRPDDARHDLHAHQPRRHLDQRRHGGQGENFYYVSVKNPVYYA